MLYDTLMPLDMCYHSDEFHECAHVKIVTQVSLLQECGNVDGSLQLMSPSRKSILLYIVLWILFNQRKPHTIETVYFR